MKNKLIPAPGGLSGFLVLWVTQSLSSLGSAMTSFALVIWSYQQTGSALSASLLTICSYAPYVLLSVFAGALSDRWSKKAVMLLSDSFAALCTLCVLFLLARQNLELWHLYLINALTGVMNAVQQPASDVAVSLLCPQKYYQKAAGLRALSNSLVTVLTPMLATALLSFAGVEGVVLFDLATFALAFLSLLCFVEIPRGAKEGGKAKEPLLQGVKCGLRYLRDNRGVLDLILFLAAINFTASIFNAALPPMVLSKSVGGQAALGMVNTATGLATLLGSLFVTMLPAPKSRVRVIFNCLLFSMSTENFILAFGKSVPVWCLGGVLGWMLIPVMNANMDALLRVKIPVAVQGRVYAARNALQFFTIPLGYLCGGVLVDKVFEPFMAAQQPGSPWVFLFGSGKGAGAALLFFAIGILGVLTCLPFRKDKHIWRLEES